jgi:two-component system nitrate/nitrite response regulator NarL
MGKVRIILSDPQVLFREGVHFTLSYEEDFEVAGETTSNEEALALIEADPPSVAILNMGDGKLDGPAVTQRIKRNLPSVSVILIMDHEDEEQVLAGIKSGASACLSKDIDPEHLIDIVTEVVKGTQPVIEQMLTPGLASRALAEFEGLPALGEEVNTLLARPSPSETEVLKCLAAGQGIEQAAAKLSSDESAIRHQLGVIVNKLVANERSLSLIKAMERSFPSIISSMIMIGKPEKYITKAEFNSFKESLIQHLKPLIGETVSK